MTVIAPIKELEHSPSMMKIKMRGNAVCDRNVCLHKRQKKILS